MKNILISLGGNCSTNYKLTDIDFEEIIGVDNGTAHLFNKSLIPSKVLGDLDSITPALLEKVKKLSIDLIRYESNKDKTDFEISLESINEPNEKNIFLIGGEEGEIDHLFSIFSLITNFEYASNITWFYMDKTIIFQNNLSISLNKGTGFSIVPITNLKSLNVSGAKWNLIKENINAGSSRTLRNESADSQVSISCSEGLFCLIY
tara:strand:+ start:357 stop:971 length:615 start_codon:yes stop_codon:yes gene_type:complete